jgi:hypothetical protein
MRVLLLGSAAVILGWTGIADAQNAPTSPQTTQQSDRGPMMRGMMGEEMSGREMEEHGRRHSSEGPMLRTNAAVFRIRRGDTSVFIKCADNEAMQACVAAAGTLLDKFNPQTPRP